VGREKVVIAAGTSFPLPVLPPSLPAPIFQPFHPRDCFCFVVAFACALLIVFSFSVFSSILSSFVHFPATLRTLLALPQSSLLRSCVTQIASMPFHCILSHQFAPRIDFGGLYMPEVWYARDSRELIRHVPLSEQTGKPNHTTQAMVAV